MRVKRRSKESGTKQKGSRRLDGLQRSFDHGKSDTWCDGRVAECQRKARVGEERDFVGQSLDRDFTATAL